MQGWSKIKAVSRASWLFINLSVSHKNKQHCTAAHERFWSMDPAIAGFWPPMGVCPRPTAFFGFLCLSMYFTQILSIFRNVLTQNCKANRKCRLVTRVLKMCVEFKLEDVPRIEKYKLVSPNARLVKNKSCFSSKLVVHICKSLVFDFKIFMGS